MQIFYVTTNAHKVAEATRLLASYEIVATDSGDPDETAPDFEGNALLKARTWHAPGTFLVLAEDSGLEVEALGGRPGVYSKRYGPTPQARIDRVLAELESEENRGAAFVAVSVLMAQDGSFRSFEGRCAGEIASYPRGSAGFGYDPIFCPNGGEGRTFAEMSGAEKDSYSHRSKSLHKVKEFLESPAGRVFVQNTKRG